MKIILSNNTSYQMQIDQEEYEDREAIISIGKVNWNRYGSLYGSLERYVTDILNHETTHLGMSAIGEDIASYTYDRFNSPRAWLPDIIDITPLYSITSYRLKPYLLREHGYIVRCKIIRELRYRFNKVYEPLYFRFRNFRTHLIWIIRDYIDLDKNKRSLLYGVGKRVAERSLKELL